MPERRKFVRIPKENILFVSECDVMEELNLKDKGEKIQAKTLNISAGGLLFEAGSRFDIGKVLKIELMLPHWEKYKRSLERAEFTYPTKPFLLLGQVVRLEFLRESLYDIGVTFVGIEEDCREILVAYVNAQLEEEKAREAEGGAPP
jgi:hypothetical protein